jgi:hypothetical protein
MAEETERYHVYNAEASVLSGFLKLPFESEITPHVHVQLPESGGYGSKRVTDVHLESAISYSAAKTHVGGNRDEKPGHGWSTLATATIEGLNIFDVVTADRVVMQINTDHPLAGYVPRVNFLGTRFENLRIGGHPVKVDLNLNHLGPKLAGDAPYTQSKEFLDRVARQYDTVNKGHDITEEGMRRYNRTPTSDACREGIECSLVNSVSSLNAGETFPGRCFGHVIDVPNFGVVYLATLKIEQSDFDSQTGVPKKTSFHVKMVEAKMGCLASGGADGGVGVVQGSTHP